MGLTHSADDGDHYAVSGLQGRLAFFALAYVPGADADPETPGKHNFWEAAGLS